MAIKYVSIQSVGPFPYDDTIWDALTTDGEIVASTLVLEGGITSNVIYGGKNPDSSLTLQSTSGAGTTDFISLRVGDNGSVEGMRINHIGSIGMGTDSPLQKLHVVGNLVVTDGRIGVGTTAPQAALAVVGAGNDTLAGVDGIMIYVYAGTPRIQFEDAGFKRWILDTDGGGFRFILMPATDSPAEDVPLTISSTGKVGIGLPIGTYGTVALDVLGAIHSGLAAELIGTSVALTAGATGNVPTLTTGPVTGNPTKWLPINDNGTTRYIPSW